MPRLNNQIPPKTQEKFDSISLHQDDTWDGVLYVKQPLTGEEGGNDQYTTGEKYMNFLNTKLKEGVSTSLVIPIRTADKIPTNNSTIRYKIVGGSRSPASTQIKGNNTIDWLQNSRNIKLELEIPLPDNDIMFFFYFTDPKQDQILIDPDGSAKKISARTYYKTKETPKVDSLNSKETIVGSYIELTGALSAFLQNEKTGSNLFVDYTTNPVKPKNARYMKIEFDGFPMANSVEISSDGLPINFTPIDKGNAKSLGVTNEDFISDDWYIDLADVRDSISGNRTKPLWRSTMSGEIHNKFRIWDTLFVGSGKNGHFEVESVNVTDNKGEINFAKPGDAITTWVNLIPNTEYVGLFPPGPANFQFSDQILDLLKFNVDRNGIKSWYNDFSFFENIYYEKAFSFEPGNPKWKISNSFLTFDVGNAKSDAARAISMLAISNPKKNISNPNFSKEDYYEFVRNVWRGSVNINGTTFTGWPNKLEVVNKDDKIYKWNNDNEHRKYIVLTPEIDYVTRYKHLLKTGGQVSGDNNTNLKIGKSQIVSARHPFPTGDGSIDIHYDANIFFDKAYTISNGWPTGNKVIFDLESEKTIDRLLLNIYAGIKYRITFYDKNFKPSIGLDENGNDVTLSPTIVNAGNLDISNDPLKSATEIIFGLPARAIL